MLKTATCIHGTRLTQNCIYCEKEINLPNMCATEAVERMREAQMMKEIAATGLKFDSDKPRMDLIDAEAIDELAKVLTFGAEKYEAHNWRKGLQMSRLIAASMRHLLAINKGETLDEETGLQHAAHLMCCAMFMTWTLKNRPEMDDRWKLNSNKEV